MDRLLGNLGVTPETAIVVMAALSAAAVVLATWRALLWRDPVTVRLKQLRRRQEDLRAGLIGARRRGKRQQTAKTAMQAVAQRLDLLKSRTAEGVTDKLARAGWRSQDALVTFLIMKLVMPFAFAGVAFFLLHGIDLWDLPEIAGSLAPFAAVMIGFYAPEVYVKNAIARREKAISKGLPDALDLLVICAEAGLALDPALHRVAREMAQATPEMAEEFGLTAIELGFLPERRKALENLSRRCQLSNVRGVVTTLLQTERYGTPLAQSLRVLAAEFRDERMLKAEEKAAKLPAILTVPLIIFIMPALIVVLLGPGIIRIMDGLSHM
jgi:tight adherence protein C